MLKRHNHCCGRHLSDAEIAVDGVRIEVNGVASLHAVRDLAMTHIKSSRQQIEKLTAGVLMRARHTAFFQRQELREVWIELPVGHVITQALEEIRWIVDTGLRQ